MLVKYIYGHLGGRSCFSTSVLKRWFSIMCSMLFQVEKKGSWVCSQFVSKGVKCAWSMCVWACVHNHETYIFVNAQFFVLTQRNAFPAVLTVMAGPVLRGTLNMFSSWRPCRCRREETYGEGAGHVSGATCACTLHDHASSRMKTAVTDSLTSHTSKKQSNMFMIGWTSAGVHVWFSFSIYDAVATELMIWWLVSCSFFFGEAGCVNVFS